MGDVAPARYAGLYCGAMRILIPYIYIAFDAHTDNITRVMYHFMYLLLSVSQLLLFY